MEAALAEARSERMRMVSAERILRAVRPDLLVAMRMIAREQTTEAHLRLTMCVAALDDALEELYQ